MNRVENIESQVKSLSPEELKGFRDWFARFDAEVWDAQIVLARASSNSQRTRQGRLLSNFQPGIRYCIACASLRAPSPMP